MIKKSENPHPFMVVLIILGVILLFYIMHFVYVKQSLMGTWRTEKDAVFDIHHDKFKDIIYIRVDEKYIKGYMENNVIFLKYKDTTKIGVYLDDTIKWVDGTSWDKVKA